MAGGLLNLVSVGNQNIFLTGNPSKTFFKSVYAKYTNFGLQKFRIDYDGLRSLRLSESSDFSFRIPRNADLLMDTYLVVTLPNIWSPIYPPYYNDQENFNTEWVPYEFKWIENLGTEMIEQVRITVGGQELQRFSGAYLNNMVKRDFTSEKRKLFDEMTGNIPYFNDPGNSSNRVNAYPNAFWNNTMGGAEPSIRSRNIYIPINAWFSLTSKQAFPLIALQYNELVIHVRIRPIQELFTIRDVKDKANFYPYIQPNFNLAYQQLYTFVQTPPDVSLNYTDKRSLWNADIHLISTYAFLSDDEQKIFAANEQRYLIKNVFEYRFYDKTGSNRVTLDSLGMVSSWMWFFRRSDANLRNEWTNYTNWPYKYQPSPIQFSQDFNYTNPISNPMANKPSEFPHAPLTISPDFNGDGTNSTLFLTGPYTTDNQKQIMQTWGLILDGDYRENIFDSGVFNYIEKYVRTSGFAEPGLYCYNFTLHTDPFDLQPSGALNLNFFNHIQFDFTTYIPPLDASAQFYQVCNNDGQPIGINQPTWRNFDYTYDLVVFEERYNRVIFSNGNAGLEYAI